MDFATIGGLIFSIVVIATGAILEHITLSSLLGPSAFLIVVGGSIGATIVSHTMEDLKRVPLALKTAVAPPKIDYGATIEYLVDLAQKGRRQGLLALQDDAENAESPLVRRGLTMVVDGVAPEVVEEVLEAAVDIDAEKMTHAAQVFDTAGGFSPTLGILGTVMGLVTIMGNLSEPDTLGPAIAVAFLATLYGVFFANLVFLPMGAKIKAIVRQQVTYQEMVIAGILGIQAGELPRNLKERLSVFLGTDHKSKKAAAAAGAQAAVHEGGV